LRGVNKTGKGGRVSIHEKKTGGASKRKLKFKISRSKKTPKKSASSKKESTPLGITTAQLTPLKIKK